MPKNVELKFNRENRQDRDENYCEVATIIAKRSTCVRHNYGVVIAKDNQIVSTGYNGAPCGEKHCIEIGCLRDEMNIKSANRLEICRGVHAEQNALIQAGKNSQDATLYTTAAPCKICAKLILNAKISRIVILPVDNYPDKEGIKLLENAGIKIDFLKLNNINNK